MWHQRQEGIFCIFVIFAIAVLVHSDDEIVAEEKDSQRLGKGMYLTYFFRWFLISFLLQCCQFSKWSDFQMMFVLVDQEMELALQRK